MSKGKVYVETLGCPKNFNDTEICKSILENDGYKIVDNPENADIIIVNTCGFINDAKKESISKIFEMNEFGKTLVVSGCLSQRYHEDLVKELPEADILIGVNEYKELPKILNEYSKDNKDFVSNKVCDTVENLPRKIAENPYTETLKIAEGCDNKCAYCVIPEIRGKFRSKKKEDIIFEAKELAKKGVKELILIAQDITNYGMDLYGRYELPSLLKELNDIEGIVWIRLMYCYEDRITDELIDQMANIDKVCHYIDIPIQHGSDNVLNLMKRRSTNKSIKEVISKLREKVKDIHIRTTLIVGFPGETEEDFNILYDFVDEIKFDRLGVFSYSKEENTVAGEMDNQIDEDIKQNRLDSIMRLQNEISLKKNQEKIGNTYLVLVEAMDSDNSYIGRTEYDAPEIDNSVIFKSDTKLEIGSFVNVKITDAFDYDLVGEIVKC